MLVTFEVDPSKFQVYSDGFQTTFVIFKIQVMIIKVSVEDFRSL